MKILILGASGMLGNAMFRVLSASGEHETFGTIRNSAARRYFDELLATRLLDGVDVMHHDSLAEVFARVRPQVVINCIGLVKQLASVNDPLHAVPVNSLLPHRLARLAELCGARLVHFSTDCVFSGAKGYYVESDFADADDLYGRSKLLGEVDYPHAITLRTSIIGHELEGRRSLINWFLSQEGGVNGYTRAIFSGLPTVEMASVVRDFVLPAPALCGLYHVSAAPVSKFDLLKLVAEAFDKRIEIRPSEDVVLDRSLDSGRFRAATGYQPAAWPVLIERMRQFR